MAFAYKLLGDVHIGRFVCSSRDKDAHDMLDGELLDGALANRYNSLLQSCTAEP